LFLSSLPFFFIFEKRDACPPTILQAYMQKNFMKKVAGIDNINNSSDSKKKYGVNKLKNTSYRRNKVKINFQNSLFIV